MPLPSAPEHAFNARRFITTTIMITLALVVVIREIGAATRASGGPCISEESSSSTSVSVITTTTRAGSKNLGAATEAEGNKKKTQKKKNNDAGPAGGDEGEGEKKRKKRPVAKPKDADGGDESEAAGAEPPSAPVTAPKRKAKSLVTAKPAAAADEDGQPPPPPPELDSQKKLPRSKPRGLSSDSDDGETTTSVAAEDPAAPPEPQHRRPVRPVSLVRSGRRAVSLNQQQQQPKEAAEGGQQEEEPPVTAKLPPRKKKASAEEQPAEPSNEESDEGSPGASARRKAGPPVKPPGICPQGLSKGHKPPLCNDLKRFCAMDATNPNALDCSHPPDSSDEGTSVDKKGFLDALRHHLLVDRMTLIEEFALKNIHDSVSNMVKLNLPGVFMETGVWKGGASIYARAAMDVLGLQNRYSYLLDSYCGLPASNSGLYSQVADVVPWHTMGWLKVSLEDVKKNFERMCIPKRHVRFVKGFFQDTAPIVREQLIKKNQTIAVLRLDGDIYESTVDVLYNLYDLVDVGGYVIIDDWVWETLQYHAKLAVLDFFDLHGLHKDHFIERIDDIRAFFVKRRQVEVKQHLYSPTDKTKVRSTARDSWGETEYRSQRTGWEKKHNAEKYTKHNDQQRQISQYMSELEPFLPTQYRKPLWNMPRSLFETAMARAAHVLVDFKSFAKFYFATTKHIPPNCKKSAGCVKCTLAVEGESGSSGGEEPAAEHAAMSTC